MFVDKGFPVGEFFIAPIQAEVQRKAHGAADIMTRDRIVGERIRVIAMIVMTIDIVKQTPHMLAQGVIKNQERVSLRPAYLLGLLEQILDTPVVDAVLKPRRFGEKAGEIGFVRTLQDTASDVRQAFVVQNDQACQIILEMVKLAPILEEVSENIGMSSHERRGSHDWKLHQALPFRVEDGIGPESITQTSAMAKHNSRVKEPHARCYASATAYVMMIPACNSCSVRLKKLRRWPSSSWPCGR
jgi:hypothetical protein